jgi:hypothetical protein
VRDSNLFDFADKFLLKLSKMGSLGQTETYQDNISPYTWLKFTDVMYIIEVWAVGVMCCQLVHNSYQEMPAVLRT